MVNERRFYIDRWKIFRAESGTKIKGIILVKYSLKYNIAIESNINKAL
jgi:hypothetical protein